MNLRTPRLHPIRHFLLACAVAWSTEGCTQPTKPSLPPSLPASAPKPTREALRQELLAAHAAVLAAHRQTDWRYFGQSVQDPFWVVNNGNIRAFTPSQQQERFLAYLESVQFSAYEDLQEPVVGLSDDASMGWVAVRVRARGTTRGAQAQLFDDTWAWLMVYERRGDRWVARANASNKAPAPWAGTFAELPSDLPEPARVVLAELHEALGGPAAVAAIQWIESEADTRHPRGQSLLKISGDTNGNVSFWQRTSGGQIVQWTHQREQAFSHPEHGKATPLTVQEDAALLGHAFHLAILAPHQLWKVRDVDSQATWRGQSCQAINFVDGLGAPISIYYDKASHLPLGMQQREPGHADGQPITIVFLDWRAYGTLRLPSVVELNHRGDLYRFTFTRLALNEGPRPNFARPAQ